MTQENRIKNKIIALLFLIILISAGVNFYYQHTNASKNFERSIDKLHANISRSFHKILSQLKDNLSIISDTIISQKALQQALKSKDRQSLYHEALPFYHQMIAQNAYIKIMTFRLADGSAFLRMHKPYLFGDKLNANRKIIIETNRLQKRLYGFESDKLQKVFRVTSPIFYDGVYIGLMEIGVEPEYLMDQTRDVFETKDALFIKDAQGNYTFARGDQLFSSHIDAITFEKRFTLTTQKGDHYMIDPGMDLLDFKEEVTAKLLYAYAINDHLDTLDKATKELLINTLLSLLIIFFILQYFSRHFIDKLKKLTLDLRTQSEDLKRMNDTLEERVQIELVKNREKEQQMLEQSRMAQMGEMLSMIAHQWRQPLGSISAISANIQMKLELRNFDFSDEAHTVESIEKLSSYLKDIDNCVESLSTTINDFRNFYKPDKESTQTAIKEPITRALDIIRASLAADGVLIEEHYESSIIIKLYENEMMQVILSILKNAEDNFKENRIAQPKISIRTRDENESVIIEICDNGGGIPASIIPQIFVPYFSTKTAKNGTGLGLHMSKTIIEQHHNGEIYAYNSDEGACFVITLNPNNKSGH